MAPLSPVWVGAGLGLRLRLTKMSGNYVGRIATPVSDCVGLICQLISQRKHE
jgi:hypothetical protein